MSLVVSPPPSDAGDEGGSVSDAVGDVPVEDVVVGDVGAVRGEVPLGVLTILSESKYPILCSTAAYLDT